MSNANDIRPAIQSVINEWKEKRKLMNERGTELYNNNKPKEFFEQLGSAKTLRFVIEELESLLELYRLESKEELLK